MSRPKTYPRIEDLRDLFNYDPETGDFTWAITRSSTARFGDDAGTFIPGRGICVTINRQRYEALRVIVAVQTGDWHPDHHIYSVGGPRDLKLANIRMEVPSAPVEPVLSTQADVARAKNREYARRFRERRKAREKETAWQSGEFASSIDGVTYSAVNRCWTASTRYRGGGYFLLGDRYATKKDAENAVMAYHFGKQYVDEHPIPVPVSQYDLDALNKRLVPGGLTLGQLHQLVAYDPLRGAIYWREGVRKGTRADQTRPYGKGPVVAHNGRYYAAARIGWALTHGYWPTKHLRNRDGDPRNNKLSNLVVKENANAKALV